MAEPEQLDLLPPAEPEGTCSCSNTQFPDGQLYPYPFHSAPGLRLVVTTSPGARDICIGLVENHGGDFRAIGLDADAADRLAEDLRARATALRELGKPGLEKLGRAVHPLPAIQATRGGEHRG